MKQKFYALTILLLAAAAVLLCVSCGQQRETAETAVLSDLPLNQYDKSLFVPENGRISYQNASAGIDVSSHQGEIDWQAVKEDGIDFAIIRAAYRGYTNGDLSMDPCFRENLKGAMDGGLAVGVYLFSQAVSIEEAEEEANFLLECLDGAELDLPVYYDWEPIDAESRTEDTTGREVTDFALAFCQIIEENGYKAGVYFNESMGYSFFRLPELKKYDFWLAQYLSVPDFYYDFAMWQYSASGEVAGIQEPVDMNLRFAE